MNAKAGLSSAVKRRTSSSTAFALRINSRDHTVDVDGDTPLLWVLRDSIDLKGTKFGCGAGLCGACTVHLEGAPVRSCMLPMASVGKAAVTTIEGIGGMPIGATDIAIHRRIDFAVTRCWIVDQQRGGRH